MGMARLYGKLLNNILLMITEKPGLPGFVRYALCPMRSDLVLMTSLRC
jgi:hypothetical protein